MFISYDGCVVNNNNAACNGPYDADDEPGHGEGEAPVGGHEGSRHQGTSTKERKNWA